MKIAIDSPIRNIRDEPMKEQDGSFVTLRNVVIGALLNGADQDKVDGQTKAKRFAQALRLQTHLDIVINLTTEEIAEIKRLIAPLFNTLVTGRSYEILETPYEILETPVAASD